jgi:hypothetical protein
MSKTLMCAVLFAALTVPALAAEPPSPVSMDKRAAYALLDSIGEMFHQMAATGTGWTEKLEKGLQQFMADAKKAKSQKQIDPVFYRRYWYLLAIVKMTARPDPGGILLPVIDRELGQFVGSVLGEEWKGSGPGAIGQVLNAIAYEIVDLQMYVDNLEAREKLRKTWDEKFIQAAPPKKGPEAAPVR